MFDARILPSHLAVPRRGLEDRPGRPFHRPYETVEEDFDDFRLDDLRRQAETGAIDVADL